MIILQKDFTRQDQAVLKELKKQTRNFKKLPKGLRNFDTTPEQTRNIRRIARKLDKSYKNRVPLLISESEKETLNSLGLKETAKGIEHLVSKRNNNEIRNRYLRIRKSSNNSSNLVEKEREKRDSINKSLKKNYEAAKKRLDSRKTARFPELNEKLLDYSKSININIQDGANPHFLPTKSGGGVIVANQNKDLISTSILSHEIGHAESNLRRTGRKKFSPISNDEAKDIETELTKKKSHSGKNNKWRIKRRRQSGSFQRLAEEYAANNISTNRLKEIGATKRQLRKTKRDKNTAINTYVSYAPSNVLHDTKVRFKLKDKV